MEQSKKLLVCIAHHSVPGRREYLQQLLETFGTYELDVSIIVDTNIPIEANATVVVNTLEHPYHLTWIHRKHFLENIDNYDYFMYVEDDMLVPFDNFKNYIENFSLLWPRYVPSFIRIEEKEGKQVITDITSRQHKKLIRVGEKQFSALAQPYHAFWIMPRKELKETLTPNFKRLELSRETAASYPMWELRKTPLVEINNEGQVSPLCYSYHLANNYINDAWSQFGKIEVNNIFYENN